MCQQQINDQRLTMERRDVALDDIAVRLSGVASTLKKTGSFLAEWGHEVFNTNTTKAGETETRAREFQSAQILRGISQVLTGWVVTVIFLPMFQKSFPEEWECNLTESCGLR